MDYYFLMPFLRTGSGYSNVKLRDFTFIDSVTNPEMP